MSERAGMAIGRALGFVAVQCATGPFVGSAGLRSQQCKPRRQPQRRAASMSMQQTKKVTSAAAETLLSEFREASATPLPLLRQVAEAMVEEMTMGLRSEGGSDQLKMLPTFVENLPTGCVIGVAASPADFCTL